MIQLLERREPDERDWTRAGWSEATGRARSSFSEVFGGPEDHEVLDDRVQPGTGFESRRNFVPTTEICLH